MNLDFHPAPGLGGLLPGFFVVPQNPVHGPTSYVHGIGDILPGSFAVPQNPVSNYSTGNVLPLGTAPGAKGRVNGVSGIGCGGDCGCTSCSHGGMGSIMDDFNTFTTDLTSGDYMQAVKDPILGIPAWGWGLVVAAIAFSGGEGHSYASRSRRAASAARRAF